MTATRENTECRRTTTPHPPRSGRDQRRHSAQRVQVQRRVAAEPVQRRLFHPVLKPHSARQTEFRALYGSCTCGVTLYVVRYSYASWMCFVVT